MVSVKEKYGFLPTSVWHLDKKNTLNDFFKDNSKIRTARRGSNSFLPDYKLSEFNPNVAERVIKYWSEKNNIIFDPFAGRATRGLIATKLGRNYIGCEISKNTFDWVQNIFNKIEKQKLIKSPKDNFILLNEDGCSYHNSINQKSIDLIFTCPPYWNLEKYESCDGQLSDCKNYNIFLKKINDCINENYRILKSNKFSVWVVSDWRNNSFFCFHKDLIDIHLKNGFVLWDIVINVLNSPFVAFKAGFNDKQKYTGKTHEYIIVFKKSEK